MSTELENFTDEETLLTEGTELENIKVLAEGFGRKFVHDIDNNYYYLKVKPGVAVLLKDGEDYIFVQQYRPPVQSTTTELICGGVGDNEDVMEAAIREIRNETGYALKGLRKIGNFYASPSALNEQFTLFVAEVESKQNIEHDEEIDIDSNIVRMSRSEILTKIRDGEFLLSSLAIAVLFDTLVTRK